MQPSIIFFPSSLRGVYPSFQILKGEKNFQINNKCEQEFQALKDYLYEILLVTKPEVGEVLYLYLRVIQATTSIILLRKID